MNIGVRRLWLHARPFTLALICVAVALSCTNYLVHVLGTLANARQALLPGQLLDLEIISTGATAAILAVGALTSLRWALGFGLVTLAQALTTGSAAHRRVARAAQRVAPRIAQTTLVTAASAGLALTAVPAVAADSVSDAAGVTTQQQPAYLGFAPIPKPSQAAPDAESAVTVPAPAPKPALSETEPDPRTGSTEAVSVTVQPGDSLWSLTQQLVPDASPSEIASLWPALYQENQDVIGSNPDLILPGTPLAMPASFTSSPVR